MLFKGFFVTHKNQKGFDKIIERIRELGVDVYNYYNCMPEYIIIVKKEFMDYKINNQIIYFKCSDMNFNKLHLLGFGFNGLFEDEEKIMEIEKFGKYRCIINDINNIEISNDKIEILNFIF